MWRLLLPVVVAIGCGGAKREERAPPARLVVIVEVTAAGYGAEEVEHLVIVPIEGALAGAPEVATIDAVATDGRGRLVVEVAAGSDPLQARSAIAARLARVDLPDEVEAPVLAPAGVALVLYTLTSDRHAPADLWAMHEDVVRHRLQQLRGVAEVLSCGGAREVLEVAIDAGRMTALDLSAAEIAAALSGGIQAPAGAIDVSGTQMVVRVRGTSLPDVEAVVVKVHGDGVPVRISDVAQVHLARRPAPCQAFGGDGAALIAGMVMMFEPTPDAVAARLDELRAELPAGVRLERFADGEAPLQLRVATRVTGEETLVLAAEVARAAGRGGAARVIAMVDVDAGAGDRLPGEIDVWIAPGRAGAGVLDALRALPGVEARPAPGTPATQVIVLRGEDRDALEHGARGLRAGVEQIAGVQSVAVVGTVWTLRPWIELDRARATALGVSAGDVADALRMATRGLEVARFADGARELAVELRWAERGDDSDLAAIPVRTATGSIVPLGELVTITRRDTPVALLRAAGSPALRLEVTAAPGVSGQVERELRRLIDTSARPVGVRAELR